MKRAYSWVPRGSSRSTYSAPTIANRNDLALRLIVENIAPANEALDGAEPKRIDLVQRPEFARGIPPAMRERAEFGDFGWVDVHETSIHDIRLCHQWALAAMSCSSSPVRRLSKTRGSPATHTWVTCSRPSA